MSIIAVAGGTGKLGRAVVDGIIADGKFDVVVLAREVSIFSHLNDKREAAIVR